MRSVHTTSGGDGARAAGGSAGPRAAAHALPRLDRHANGPGRGGATRRRLRRAPRPVPRPAHARERAVRRPRDKSKAQYQLACIPADISTRNRSSCLSSTSTCCRDRYTGQRSRCPNRRPSNFPHSHLSTSPRGLSRDRGRPARYAHALLAEAAPRVQADFAAETEELKLLRCAGVASVLVRFRRFVIPSDCRVVDSNYCVSILEDRLRRAF